MGVGSVVTAVVDAHVHLHSCYRPGELLTRAAENLSKVRPPSTFPARRSMYLLMAECRGDDAFGTLKALAEESPTGVSRADLSAGGMNLGGWSVHPTDEASSVIVQNASARMYIVAGRQIACREGLEVLVLGTVAKFEDGRPIREVLRETEALDVPRVIPWGPGKWFGRRGRLLNELLLEFRKPTLFLGDEGGRPGFWHYPSHFAYGQRLGVRDLPGTDPLPFSHDVDKVGRMGFCVPVELNPAKPAASLIEALTHPATTFERFATLEPPLRFVRNQIGMQLRKHRMA